jgi:hypothetical protein
MDAAVAGAHLRPDRALGAWTVYRTSRYPTHFDLNVVRVRDDPGMSVEALIGFADAALAGLEHRRIDFDSAQVAEPPRAEFHARGFKSTRLVWMHFEGPRPDGAEIPGRWWATGTRAPEGSRQGNRMPGRGSPGSDDSESPGASNMWSQRSPDGSSRRIRSPRQQDQAREHV